MENRHAGTGANEPETWVEKWLTVPGRLLLIFWIVATIGAFVWWRETTTEGMPEGAYPLMWWTTPAMLVGCAGFLVTAMILERIGVRIYRRGQ